MWCVTKINVTVVVDPLSPKLMLSCVCLQYVERNYGMFKNHWVKNDKSHLLGTFVTSLSPNFRSLS